MPTLLRTINESLLEIIITLWYDTLNMACIRKHIHTSRLVYAKLCFVQILQMFTGGKIRVFMHHFADLFTPGGKLSPSNQIKRQKNKA